MRGPLENRDAMRVLGLTIIMLLLLATAITPRGVWWALASWQYRHPDKVEPSEASFFITRLGAILALLLFGGMALMSLAD